MRCGLLPPTRYDFYPRPPRGGRPGQRHCADHLQNFYPRPPRGGRPATALHRGKAAVFLSTPSARRATFWRFRNGLCDEISIHALREEGDPLQSPPCALLSNFYPRPPRGGRLLTQQEITQINDFYPRPPRGGRRIAMSDLNLRIAISIHALREEGDAGPAFPRCRPAISIHALREEGDATVFASSAVKTYFYPRPPRGGRRRGVRPAHHHHQ